MTLNFFLKEKSKHGTPLLPLRIHYLTYAESKEEGYVFFYSHWHSEIEIFVVKEGAVIYMIEDKEYILRAGEGVFVNSNKLHMARAYKGQPCVCGAIVFQPTFLIDNINAPAYEKYIYPVLAGHRVFHPKLTQSVEWQRQAISEMIQICNLKEEETESRELWIKGELLKVWDLCYRHPVKKDSEAVSVKKSYKLKRMEPVMHYIHQHYSEEIALSDLAEIIPMSEGQFCRSFKEIMNMSPIAYVVRYRILKGCTMLKDTDDKIGDIARDVGFGNISYFNREFLRVIGCSPSTYRKRQMQEQFI